MDDRPAPSAPVDVIDAAFALRALLTHEASLTPDRRARVVQASLAWLDTFGRTTEASSVQQALDRSLHGDQEPPTEQR